MTDQQNTNDPYDRELLIANLSWWAGWCTDNEGTLPELTRLGWRLLDAKQRIALDRPVVPVNTERKEILRQMQRDGQETGMLDLPPVVNTEQTTELTRVQYVARRGGRTDAMIERLLSLAKEGDVRVEVVYPDEREVKAEQREADAQIAEKFNKGFSQHPHDKPWAEAQRRIAAAIREGGQSKEWARSMGWNGRG